MWTELYLPSISFSQFILWISSAFRKSSDKRDKLFKIEDSRTVNVNFVDHIIDFAVCRILSHRSKKRRQILQKEDFQTTFLTAAKSKVYPSSGQIVFLSQNSECIMKIRCLHIYFENNWQKSEERARKRSGNRAERARTERGRSPDGTRKKRD